MGNEGKENNGRAGQLLLFFLEQPIPQTQATQS